MSKITRPDLDVVAFGSQAQAGERTVFGDEATVSDDLTVNLNSDFIRGWAAGLDPVNGFPPMEFFNGQIFTISQLLSYLFQHGISEWNINQFYPKHAICQLNGTVYIAKENNAGNNPAVDPVNWANFLDALNVIYDNSTSGSTATEVQSAIDELFSNLGQATETTSGTAEIATTAEAQSGTNDSAFITPLKMRQGFNASGTAPVYACRAWANFSGIGTVVIRKSGNVSSVADNGVGDYTVNFATAMADSNHAHTISAGSTGNNRILSSSDWIDEPTPLSFRFRIVDGNNNNDDPGFCHIAVFR